MADLLNKLRMLDAAPKKPPAPQASAEPKPEPFHHTTDVFPLSLFTDRKHFSKDVLESIFGMPFPEAVKPEDVLFLDTETTGLSGGVGTVAFQIGIGYLTESGFAVEQFLMRDYPEEGAMLNALDAVWKRFSVLCTFNGRSFDVPLLQSRFLMNRTAHPHVPAVHADVLYPARRLWKLRLRNCRLGHLEQELLHVEREDDLPGALVPQTYFQYLKDGVFEPLQKILDHNKQDIVSLAQLLFFLCKQVDRPESIENSADLFSLAKALEKNGQNDKAMHCYRLTASTSLRTQARTSMAVMEKRAGNVDAAIKLYLSVLSSAGPADAAAACEALAKLHEHQLRDIQSALSYTRQGLLLLSEPSLFCDEAIQQRRSALQYRYARLRRRLGAKST